MKPYVPVLFLTLYLIALSPVQAGKIWHDKTPLSHGSAQVLEKCFSQADLARKPGERKTRKRGKGAYLAPPEQKRPKHKSARLKREYFGSIRSVDVGDRKIVALGFDIGEQNNDLAGYDGEIVDFLRSNKIRATFYLGGKWMATHAERAKQLIADPLFEIGNHAWTHGNFRRLNRQEAADQIHFTEVQYETLRGDLADGDCSTDLEMALIPKRILTFRFPYGTCNANSLKQVNEAGLPAVQWDIVTGDPAPGQSARAIARALRRIKPGSIVVAHANGRGWNTAAAIKQALPKLIAQGWEFVTVTELLEAGTPRAVKTCYEERPGDNKRYDRLFGKGTGE